MCWLISLATLNGPEEIKKQFPSSELLLILVFDIQLALWRLKCDRTGQILRCRIQSRCKLQTKWWSWNSLEPSSNFSLFVLFRFLSSSLVSYQLRFRVSFAHVPGVRMTRVLAFRKFKMKRSFWYKYMAPSSRAVFRQFKAKRTMEFARYAIPPSCLFFLGGFERL